MTTINSIKIIRPDDWHVHLREGDMMKAVIEHSYRINHRCVVMPNLNDPIISSALCLSYKKEIYKLTSHNNFIPLVPCYLTENIDLDDFRMALKKNIFFGAKLYPSNATTNSTYGVSAIKKIYPVLDILQELNEPLLIHGEIGSEEINIFDREQYFIDKELKILRKNFPELKIVLEHVSSKYGADFVNENNKIAGTITPQHLMLTKKDVFFNDILNPHHFCKPVVKNESDLISLRKYACSGNVKFFLGTDSAPHHIDLKTADFNTMPGIFSSPCSIELYAEIFDQENSIHNLESFSSINGPNFYNLPINSEGINLVKEKNLVPEFTYLKNIRVKNFMGGKEINWKVKNSLV
ncbi:dihydroorotase [Alphaproteobacteria bacterium]|nr:dihydroorotase [Alphaproteobacteria bacterium]